MPQHGSHRSRPRLIVQAGPPGQKRQRLIGTEHVHRDGGRQIRCRLPGAGDQNLGRTVGRNKRPQRLRVCHIVENQQATVPVGLQQVPHRLARIGDIPPGTAIGQSRGLSHRSQSRLQATGFRGVDPGHQPPAVRQLRPRVCGRQLRSAGAQQPGRRVNHQYPGLSPVQLCQQVGPGLETRRLQRDITHDDLVARRLRWQRLLGPRPGAGRVLMVDHRHTGGGIYVPLGVRVLLDVAINGLVHYPLPRQGFPEAGQATALILRLRMSTYPPCPDGTPYDRSLATRRTHARTALRSPSSRKYATTANAIIAQQAAGTAKATATNL